MRWYLVAIDATEPNLYREPSIKHKRKPLEKTCKDYISKGAVELFNFPSIHRNTKLLSLERYSL